MSRLRADDQSSGLRGQVATWQVRSGSAPRALDRLRTSLCEEIELRFPQPHVHLRSGSQGKRHLQALSRRTTHLAAKQGHGGGHSALGSNHLLHLPGSGQVLGVRHAFAATGQCWLHCTALDAVEARGESAYRGK